MPCRLPKSNESSDTQRKGKFLHRDVVLEGPDDLGDAASQGEGRLVAGKVEEVDPWGGPSPNAPGHRCQHAQQDMHLNRYLHSHKVSGLGGISVFPTPFERFLVGTANK